MGVPFFGKYEDEDLLGLIEIAANIGNRDSFGITPSAVEEWEALLLAYDQATDKDAFLREVPPEKAQYFMNRYGEWSEVNYLTRDISLAGLKVLDVGAGLGFDSHRLSLLGAHVTALEFSPLLAESGLTNFPHIRWVGGFSHCLPFRNASFDAVFCNAALHHMRDVPAAIFEALRVLRPNGILITTCDSFRPSASGDDLELEIFDRDPAVLLGVNEGIPRFSDFISTLERHAEILDIELLTHVLYDAPDIGTITHLKHWNLEKDGPMLAGRSGSIAMRVRLKDVWPDPARVQMKGVLSAHEYVSWMSSASNAVSKLAPMMPQKYVNLPFFADKGSKFELLNGWRRPQKYHHARTAYRRGRWFMQSPPEQPILAFDISLPRDGSSGVEAVKVMLNGAAVGDYPVSNKKWVSAKVDIAAIPSGDVFSIELEGIGGGASIEEAAFVVRNRRLISNTPGLDVENKCRNCQNSTVYAVIPVFNRLHFTRECIRYLKEQTYIPLKIIIADGGSTDGTRDIIRAEFPDVVVLSPADAELWWSGSMAMGIDYALRDSSGVDDYVLMMNNDTQFPADYVETLVAVSKLHDAAVGALIVDSRDATRVLDAGEYIDWATYTFSVKHSVDDGERFCDDVDVLPGRGSLIPLRMIRAVGNIDASMLPHYLADYEFFCRFKEQGFRLGVSYETQIVAHIEETGIMPTSGSSAFRAIWHEIFSRRSMSNFLDHWRFVTRHAPKEYRNHIRFRLVKRVIADLTLRTPARWFFFPIYLLLTSPWRTWAVVKGQKRAFSRLGAAIRRDGADVVCQPKLIPGIIRLPVYLAVAPGPLKREHIEEHGLVADELLRRGILRQTRCHEWYALNTVNFGGDAANAELEGLRRKAWNPVAKVGRTFSWYMAMRKTRVAE
ncbi:glycosyltransferase [Rhizobium leguminosarum]|nr:glycosyltransferase [Rhizobium leguminosarum]